jgi:parallel beta-helix repeat protein
MFSTISSLRLTVIFTIFFTLLIFPSSASADSQTITVDTTLDSNDPAYQQCTAAANDCSLRGAISRANNFVSTNYTILVPTGTYTLTIPGKDENENATGDLDITTSMVLQGAGMDSTIIQAGTNAENGIDRVIHLEGTFSSGAHLSRLTVRYGKVSDDKLGAGMYSSINGILTLSQVAFRSNTGEGYSYGAGLAVTSSAEISDCVFIGNQNGGEGGGLFQGGTNDITISRSLFSGNTSGYGGAITNNAPALLENVTISGNTATLNGGGISQWNSANLTLRNVTITGNTAPVNATGYAINNPRTVTAFNSIISAAIGKQACSAVIVAGDHNLASDASCGGSPAFTISDPLLKPLAFHGGFAPLHAFDQTSPALDAGDAAECALTDQRGMTRPQDGNLDGTTACDIGAYELQTSLIFMPLGMQNFK